MSWLSAWLKKGFSIRITLPWPGEKDLPNRDPYRPKPDDIKEIIKNMDKQKEKR